MHGLRVSIAMKEISSVEKISSKPGMTIDVLGINEKIAVLVTSGVRLLAAIICSVS